MQTQKPPFPAALFAYHDPETGGTTLADQCGFMLTHEQAQALLEKLCQFYATTSPEYIAEQNRKQQEYYDHPHLRQRKGRTD